MLSIIMLYIVNKGRTSRQFEKHKERQYHNITLYRIIFRYIELTIWN